MKEGQKSDDAASNKARRVKTKAQGNLTELKLARRNNACTRREKEVFTITTRFTLLRVDTRKVDEKS